MRFFNTDFFKTYKLTNKPRPPHLIVGERSEQRACDYLLQQGLRMVTKNFRCQYGELDIVMRDGNMLVIVEVRFRKSNKYGGALASITSKKQARIIATTQHYMLQNNCRDAVRFDVILLSNDAAINWIQNAFQ